VTWLPIVVMGVVDPFGPYVPGKDRWPDARRFEYASLPTVATFGLDACLGMLLDAGVERMAGRILEVTDRLAAGLTEVGWDVRSPRATDAEKSGIVSAVPPGGDLHGAVAALEERQVSVAARGGGVRFSPHAWNTVEEIERLLDLLA